jgi:hypothetical protein
VSCAFGPGIWATQLVREVAELFVVEHQTHKEPLFVVVLPYVRRNLLPEHVMLYLQVAVFTLHRRKAVTAIE